MCSELCHLTTAQSLNPFDAQSANLNKATPQRVLYVQHSPCAVSPPGCTSTAELGGPSGCCPQVCNDDLLPLASLTRLTQLELDCDPNSDSDLCPSHRTYCNDGLEMVLPHLGRLRRLMTDFRPAAAPVLHCMRALTCLEQLVVTDLAPAVVRRHMSAVISATLCLYP